MLDTPNTVFKPSSCLTLYRAFKVSITPFCSADAVKVKQSIKIFCLGIPIDTALSMIFLAILNLPSAVLGIPPLSRVKPTTQAPYFLTNGSILFRLSSSPFTEFTIGLPLYTLKALSKTSGIVLSNCRGTSVILCRAFTVSTIIDFSSISGSPTFTSKISAPAEVCSNA